MRSRTTDSEFILKHPAFWMALEANEGSRSFNDIPEQAFFGELPPDNGRRFYSDYLYEERARVRAAKDERETVKLGKKRKGGRVRSSLKPLVVWVVKEWALRVGEAVVL